LNELSDEMRVAYDEKIVLVIVINHAGEKVILYSQTTCDGI